VCVCVCVCAHKPERENTWLWKIIFSTSITSSDILLSQCCVYSTEAVRWSCVTEVWFQCQKNRNTTSGYKNILFQVLRDQLLILMYFEGIWHHPGNNLQFRIFGRRFGSIYFPGVHLKQLRNFTMTSFRIVFYGPNTWNMQLLNANQKCFHLSQLNRFLKYFLLNTSMYVQTGSK
jgi:hypothetical protein